MSLQQTVGEEADPSSVGESAVKSVLTSYMHAATVQQDQRANLSSLTKLPQLPTSGQGQGQVAIQSTLSPDAYPEPLKSGSLTSQKLPDIYQDRRGSMHYVDQDLTQSSDKDPLRQKKNTNSRGRGNEAFRNEVLTLETVVKYCQDNKSLLKVVFALLMALLARVSQKRRQALFKELKLSIDDIETLQRHVLPESDKDGERNLVEVPIEDLIETVLTKLNEAVKSEINHQSQQESSSQKKQSNSQRRGKAPSRKRKH